MPTTYSLWKNSSPSLLAGNNTAIYSKAVFMNAWDFTDQTVSIYGVRVYAGGLMIGQVVEVGIVIPSIDPTDLQIETLPFTYSKNVTLVSGWNTVLFDSPVRLSGSTRVLTICRINVGFSYTITGIGNGAQSVPGMTSVSLSPTSAPGKLPALRSIHYGYDLEYFYWERGAGSIVYAIEPVVGQTLLSGPARAYPLNGIPIGTTAGTVAAGNDSRLSRLDSYSLQRPRTERLDLFVTGNLSVKTEMLKRSIFGPGIIRRTSAQATAVSNGASATISILLNAVSTQSYVVTSASTVSTGSGVAVSDGDTISLSITAVSGTIDGINVSIWVEYS